MQPSSLPWARTAQMLIEWWRGQLKQIRLNKTATSRNMVSLWGLKIKGILTLLWRLIGGLEALVWVAYSPLCGCVCLFLWILSCFDINKRGSQQLGATSVTQIESWTFNLLQLAGNSLQHHWKQANHSGVTLVRVLETQSSPSLSPSPQNFNQQVYCKQYRFSNCFKNNFPTVPETHKLTSWQKSSKC